MKNFDIEKLERKNIHKTPPEDFFGKIQDNVLYNISLDKKKASKPAKVFKLNWTYAMAASLTLIFGVTAFVQFGNEDSSYALGNVPDSIKIVKSVDNETKIAPKTLEDQTSVKMNVENTHAVTVEKTESVKIYKPAVKISDKEISNSSKVTQAQVETILGELSNKEIADLGKGAEQDIYLDLYN